MSANFEELGRGLLVLRGGVERPSDSGGLHDLVPTLEVRLGRSIAVERGLPSQMA